MSIHDVCIGRSMYLYIYICIILHICIYTHVYIILCVKQCFVGVSETCRLTLKIYLFVFVLFMDTN